MYEFFQNLGIPEEHQQQEKNLLLECLSPKAQNANIYSRSYLTMSTLSPASFVFHCKLQYKYKNLYFGFKVLAL
jgi:hypothetical protein